MKKQDTTQEQNEGIRLHRHLVSAAQVILTQIFQEGVYSDKALEAAMKSHPKWGSRDRHFVAETVYESVRWWRKIWACLGREPEFTDEAMWNFMGALWLLSDKTIADWSEFDDLNLQDLKAREKTLTPAEKHSVTDWMWSTGQEQLGKDWETVISALNKKASVVLRVNTLKTNLQTLKKKLHEEKIDAQPVEGYPDALVLTKRANVFRSLSFKQGLFEVQDAGSQKIAPFLEPQKGERVYDACAGAGGKSLHLAALMMNKGKILAFDIHDWKLKELKTRAARGGVDIVETRLIEGTKTIKRLESSCDALLLDVPCTGLGALRRNPDTKWKLDQEDFERLLKTQKEILFSYSKMVKPNGRMVYATCSVLPAENELQVKLFLESEEGKGWKLEKEARELPHVNGFDGFYMALLKRV